MLTGDEAIEREQLVVLLNGVQVDEIATDRYEHLWRSCLVTVAGSNLQITLEFEDTGGTRTVSQINALKIERFYGQSVQYTYDDANQLVQVMDTLDGQTDYQYDALGRVTKITEPQGLVTADPEDTIPDRGVSEYGYDAAGNLIWETNPLGNKTHYGYDAHGNLVRLIQPSTSGAPVEHFFDFGLASSAVEPGYTAITTFTYNTVAGYGWVAGQSDLTAMVNQTSGDSALTKDAHRFRYATFEVAVPNGAYEVSMLLGDEAIERDQIQIQLEGVQVDEVESGTGEYNWYTFTVLVADGKLTLRLEDLGGSRDISQINALVVKQLLGPVTTFTYDDVGNQLTLTDPVGNTTTWTYDGLDRVESETNALNKTRTFTYDAASNLETVTDRNSRVTEYKYDPLQRLVQENWLNGATIVRSFDWDYDLAGRLEEASDPSATYTFAYDDLDRVTSITHDLAALTPNVVMTQGFDLVGRRTSLSAQIGSTAVTKSR